MGLGAKCPRGHPGLGPATRPERHRLPGLVGHGQRTPRRLFGCWAGNDEDAFRRYLLAEVTYYFVARTYNAAGIESGDSNEVQWTRPALPDAGTYAPTTPHRRRRANPKPPQNLRFTLVVLNGSGDGN